MTFPSFCVRSPFLFTTSLPIGPLPPLDQRSVSLFLLFNSVLGEGGGALSLPFLCPFSGGKSLLERSKSSRPASEPCIGPRICHLQSPRSHPGLIPPAKFNALSNTGSTCPVGFVALSRIVAKLIKNYLCKKIFQKLKKMKKVEKKAFILPTF